MKKTIIAILVVILWVIWYYTAIRYPSFSIQEQNDAKMVLFWLLLGVSFIVINYLTNRDPKKNRIFVRWILIFDLYVLWNFFLKQDLHINWVEFAIFFIFLLLLILNSFIKHRIKKIIWIVLWIWLLFFLSNAILPDFEINPLENTNTSNKNQIIINNQENIEKLKENGAKIIINRQKNDKTINITQSIQEEINIDLVKKISFLSKSDSINTDVYILIWESIIYMKPQSSIDFSISWGKLLLYSDSLNSRVHLYTNQEDEFLIWWDNLIPEKLNKIEDQKIMKDLQEIKNNKILEQNWWFLLENNITRKISKILLDISFYIFPDQYKNNLENYDSVIKLLWIEDTSNNYKDSETWSWTKKDIINQIKKWYWKTYLKLF